MKYKVSHKNIISHEEKKLLTIVFPVRVSEDRKDIINRLSYLEQNGELPKEIQILVSDDGSELKFSQEIMQLCQEKNYSYIRLDTSFFPISMARARNAAAVAIDTKYVLFQDVDLLPYQGFYQEMMKEVSIYEMDKIEDEFIMFGVIYLTQEATQDFFDTEPSIRKQKFIKYYLENRKDKVEKFSTGTSVVVFNRYHYLMHGGNSEDFEKWGFEDIEFMCRLIRARKKFPLPHEFSLDYKGFATINEYRGWKSVYRLFGDQTFSKGMIMFHSWHPVNHEGEYKTGATKNRLLFEQKMKDYKELNLEPQPLPMSENGSTLILKSNPWTKDRKIIPLWGDVSYKDGDHLSLEDFKTTLSKKKFDRVVFFNPYANENILAIYKYCREFNVPYIIVERGALRESIFFDSNGFNADSISYSPSYWDKPLTLERAQNLSNYISEERFSDESLENQPQRIGADKTRHALKIPHNKKVLFVPLQRPSDTVIKYFSGRIENFDNFNNLVAEVAKNASDWVVVVKRHPLEVEIPEIPGTINADNINVKDLLDIADKTFLINSGVGILSLLWGVEVLYAGQAFYGQPGVSKNCSTLEEVLENLNWQHDNEKVSRFLSYLIDEFYSFGKFTTRIVPLANKEGLISATTNIDFYKIRTPFTRPIEMPIRNKVEISSDSPLFDRYKGNTPTVQTIKKPASKVVAKPNTTPAKPVPAKPVATPTVSSNQNPENEMVAFHTTVEKAPLENKIRKLRRNPQSFFLDSSNPILHKIGYLMYKMKN